MPRAIVLFDGECAFCTRSVLFIFHRDPAGRFQFAPLQSEVGRSLLHSRGVSGDANTMVLLEEDRTFARSTAALRVARGLRWPWSWLGAVGLLVPRALRDAVYRAFANRRHLLWGRENHCANPSPALRARMLG